MRSRTSDTGGPEIQPLRQRAKTHDTEEDRSLHEQKRKRHRAQQETESSEEKRDVSEMLRKPQEAHEMQQRGAGMMDLSKEDLVHLLGVMEGEVQAREDIIYMLQSERTPPEVLEAHYGSAVPLKPLQALQRDCVMGSGHMTTDDVYDRPMMELERLQEKHRHTYRRMLEQLLLAEKCHRRTLAELESEKHKHLDFMNKSDDFTNLLEQDRERLKRLLEQEKVYQTRQDKEHRKRLEKIQVALVKLKSFALMLLDERQLQVEQIDQQTQKLQDLSKKLHEKEQQLEIINSKAKEDSQRIQRLELDLEHKTSIFTQEHEEMTTKLVKQESESRQLRLKMASLSHKIEELEETKRMLQKSEEDLQDLRDKISRGECGNSSLMAELENLRKKVLEMEGKDEEITKTEAQCKELKRRLQDEETHNHELKLEVEKVQKRMVHLEKLEVAFNLSKSECAQLHANFDKERTVTNNLGCELETIKKHIKELKSSESRLEQAEMSLKDDLTRLKSFTVILMDEKKNMAEKIKQEEQRNEELSKMFKAEQCKVTDVTEKLIEESKKLLKMKTEMETKVSTLTKEKQNLKSQLASEEEKRKDLNANVCQMQSKLDELEESSKKRSQGGFSDEDNKVKELTQEIEKLRNRLKQFEVVTGDLLKTEDEYELLEQKFKTEQDKANVLSLLLEEMKMQITKNKAIEKGELKGQEAELRLRCKMEEVRTRDLQADVQALKEKIHELMNKEDQLSQLQVEYTVLQKRFIEEEEKKESMSQEVIKLTKELEATKRYSRALRPSMNGRRIVDVPLASIAVQTVRDINEHAEHQTPAVFIQKSVLEENHIMSKLRQKGLKKPAVLERYPPAAAELGEKKSWNPWMKKREAITITQEVVSGKVTHINRTTSPEPRTQKTGQPLHIKVTPGHQNCTATLEITSPRAEDFFASATIIPTLGLQKPRITIVPPSLLLRSTANEAAAGPERAKSPVTITTISRAKSPESGKDSVVEHPVSPLSIITVSATPVSQSSVPQEPQEMTMGRAVFRLTPEKQTVPIPIQNNSSNIITTEDNKIHIHLGSPRFKKPEDDMSGTVTVWPNGVGSDSREMSKGTVLCSPQHTCNMGTKTQNKVTSSITISPITSTPSRETVHGTGVQTSRSATTRIPVSKGTKPGKSV